MTVGAAATEDELVEQDDLERARSAARRSEEELGEALARLERSIRDPFAVGQRIQGAIRESPATWLAGAFALGFILGRAARR